MLSKVSRFKLTAVVKDAILGPDMTYTILGKKWPYFYAGKGYTPTGRRSVLGQAVPSVSLSVTTIIQLNSNTFDVKIEYIVVERSFQTSS